MVVKNGSNAWASTSGVMPQPTSATDTSTYSPGPKPGLCRSDGPSSPIFSAEIVRTPPLGIESHALITRLSMAFSNWFLSHRTVHRSGARSNTSVTRSPV
ncbi:hypothetical protein D3C86_1960760 [compost metagenome]